MGHAPAIVASSLRPHPDGGVTAAGDAARRRARWKARAGRSARLAVSGRMAAGYPSVS
ncbi:hypothetical protein [Novacetimonas pomaceti]|uniref:hypothetical protein n=1 Tax=Novacetimonas pomaceti TaxID=2021998 RepID=UPI0014039B04|nr:hypothetical protein [Novacetimonas pomaceti]